MTAEPSKAADFVTDLEISKRWGVCDKTARRAIAALEKQRCGFPPKDPLFGGKRYWPAVDAFMKRRAGLTIAPVKPKGEENWDEQDTPAKDRRRAGPSVAGARR